jgi:putative lipoic acid-binding regulatory protein
MAPDESLLEFPCDFPIKAMGYNTADFETLVVELIKPHAPDLDLTLMTARESRNGRYLSVTVTIRATSRTQLDAIYQRLSDHERVVMAL